MAEYTTYIRDRDKPSYIFQSFFLFLSVVIYEDITPYVGLSRHEV